MSHSSGSRGLSAWRMVTGLAEATSLILRLVAGPLADAKGNHWSWTIAGYGLTAVCIPLLALSPFLGGVGVVVASTLIIVERVGKAFRSPSKSALLAQAARAVGKGRGFGVHKALDMIGAVSGPLVVSAVVATTGHLWLALAVLAVPAVVTMGLLLWLRHRVPDPSVYATEAAGGDVAASPAVSTRRQPSFWTQALGTDLPRRFFVYAIGVGLTSGGLVSFGIVSYHLDHDHIVPLAVVPVVFAGAMAVGAVAALVNGTAYDRAGARVLYVVPPLVALVPVLALGPTRTSALLGMAAWGVATGIQDSTIKAVVADLVPQHRLAGAYGVFAAIQGLAALAGGVAVGALYDASHRWLVVVVAASQVVALGLLLASDRSLKVRRAAH